MTQILLTKDARSEIIYTAELEARREGRVFGIEEGSVVLLRFQLRKVVEWGDGRCPHSTYSGHAGKNYMRRHECSECWAELKLEASL